MKKLVLLRHGQSVWNLENRFTGWTDVDLSEEGVEEANRAGEILQAHGYIFDIAYTSYLKRAIRTLWIVLLKLDLAWIPVEKSWMLNERHYGSLQGLNKEETARVFGEEQVKLWRRSADIRPPALLRTDPRNAAFEARYQHLSPQDIPLTESLVDTEQRVLRYWNKKVAPSLLNDRRVLISAHGNTLRALVKYLDNLPADGIVNINIPTAIPLVYELDDQLQPVAQYYLSKEGKVDFNG